MSLIRVNFEFGNENYFCFAVFFSSIVVHCSFAHCQRGAYLMSNYTLHIAHRFLSNLLFEFLPIYFCFFCNFLFFNSEFARLFSFLWPIPKQTAFIHLSFKVVSDVNAVVATK